MKKLILPGLMQLKYGKEIWLQLVKTIRTDCTFCSKFFIFHEFNQKQEFILF